MELEDIIGIWMCAKKESPNLCKLLMNQSNDMLKDNLTFYDYEDVNIHDRGRQASDGARRAPKRARRWI